MATALAICYCRDYEIAFNLSSQADALHSCTIGYNRREQNLFVLHGTGDTLYLRRKCDLDLAKPLRSACHNEPTSHQRTVHMDATYGWIDVGLGLLSVAPFDISTWVTCPIRI